MHIHRSLLVSTQGPSPAARPAPLCQQSTQTCSLQRLIHLQQKQVGDHSWGWSLLCQQTRGATMMTVKAFMAGVGKFRLILGPNKTCLSPPWQWRRLLIFIDSRLLPSPRFSPQEGLVRSWCVSRGPLRRLCLCLPPKAAVMLVLMPAEPLWKADPCSRAKASRRGRNLYILHLSRKPFT